MTAQKSATKGDIAPISLLDWIHLAEDIPETGLEEKRSATAEELVAIAETLGVSTCERLGVTYSIYGISDGTYRLSGRLRARITQPCIISLEPVAQDIDEPLSVDYWPASDMPPPDKGEIDLADDESDIEPMIDGRIDVGVLAYDVLAAAVDLYPRVAGATFEWEDPKAKASPEASGKVNPFAVLAQLKDTATKKKT
jgi:uncharacterized metal-binding protein YceD (DUF177 family)